MKYNKSEIMKRAWEIYRAKDGRSCAYVMVEIPKLNAIFPVKQYLSKEKQIHSVPRLDMRGAKLKRL